MVFENRMSKKMYWFNRDEVTLEWGKLHNEELYDLYYSLNIFRLIKSRRMGWVGHVACMGRGEVHIGFFWGDLSERDHLQDPGIDGSIILSWNFRKWDVRLRTGSNWLRLGTCGGYL
jgi:hypothetical protein